MLKAIYLFTLSAALTMGFAACGHKGEQQPVLNFGQERYDPEALHLALVTNSESLPIIYAERTGLYDTLGLKVQLAVYNDQPDCDTALLNRYADGGMADLTRLDTYGKRAATLRTLYTGGMGSRRALFVAGALRVKNVKALKGRTIGVTPRSADNEALNEALKQAGLGTGDVFRPQVADLRYREAMITANQIDATVLTWPYTALAQANGNHCIYLQKHPDGQTAFVTKSPHKPNAQTARQWELLEKGRRMALDSLRSPRCRARLSLILQKDYGLPRSVADTVSLPF